jgi:hypothetical protein
MVATSDYKGSAAQSADYAEDATVLAYTRLGAPDALTVVIDSDELESARQDERVRRFNREAAEFARALERDGRSF